MQLMGDILIWNKSQEGNKKDNKTKIRCNTVHISDAEYYWRNEVDKNERNKDSCGKSS